MKKISGLVICLAITGAQGAESQGAAADKAGQVTTFASLLGELTNRVSLAIHPGGAWTQLQASSYERRSTTPDDPAGWYANSDWNWFVRQEVNGGRTEQVLMDVKGPGVITRFWNAGNPNLKAALRFYVDGETAPFWEADHSGALVGENKVIGRPLSFRSVEQDQLSINPGARPGHNLYAPLPFAKGMKITYEGPVNRPGPGDGMFYNINYRLYTNDTQRIESFNAHTPETYAKDLDETRQAIDVFMKQTSLEAKAPGEKKVNVETLNPEREVLAELKARGTGSIRRIRVSLKAGDLNAAVRNVRIQLVFDGQTTVNAPIGFFFGCGDQLAVAADWYRKVDMDGNLACYWVMPYRKDAVVRLVDAGKEKISGSLEVARGDWKWDERSMYFHGSFRRMDGFEAVARQGKDYTYITVNGPGCYVGDTLQIRKPGGGWWGEGDEKIYVDGDIERIFPSHFGTGTEDYYGYAWGHPETFNLPWIAQPIGDANRIRTGGVTVNSRVRGLDAIPFSKAFRFDMEMWGWQNEKIDLDWICFWYGRPGAKALNE